MPNVNNVRATKSLKKNLKNEVLLFVDYRENYSNIEQGETQCAYIGHDPFQFSHLVVISVKMVTLTMKIT